MHDLYPLLFTPVLKDYIWGGRNLRRLFNRPLSDRRIAESWEIAAHEDGDTLVENGPLAGRTLSWLSQEMGLLLLGRHGGWAHARGKFPLLVKLLDAAQPLSVQVHPDDEYAQAHEGDELGKSEMWVVLHAEPGAAVILGLRAGVTPQALRLAAQSGNLEPLLHRIPVQVGDFVCVPAGSLHAILGGLLIAEIQQNSNTTYRVYDWNRLGPDGRPRPLHLDKALEVITFDQLEPTLPQPTLAWDRPGIRAELLCGNGYFMVERLEMAPGAVFQGHGDGQTLEIWGAIQGAAEIRSVGEPVALPAVRFALLPAALGLFEVRAAGSPTTLLRAYLPEQPV